MVSENHTSISITAKKVSLETPIIEKVSLCSVGGDLLSKCNFLAQAGKDSLKTIPQTKLFDLTESNSQMSRKVGGDVKNNYFKMKNQSFLSKDAIILSQGTEINLSELIEKGSQNDFSNQKPTSITTPCPSTLFHPKCSKIRNNFENEIRNEKSNVIKRKFIIPQ